MAEVLSSYDFELFWKSLFQGQQQAGLSEAGRVARDGVAFLEFRKGMGKVESKRC